MNIKAFIDQISDIAHLERDQQFLLLEEAESDACQRLKFLNFSTIAILVRMLFLIVLTGGGYLMFGYSAWLLILTVFLSLLFSRVAVTEINTHLLKKSLNNILAKK